LISEILINTDIFNNILLPLKELIPDNLFIVELKPLLPPETFYPCTLSPKVPLFVTLKKELEIEEFIPELLELMLLLLDIPKMEPKPE
jgi:hypothetical protein